MTKRNDTRPFILMLAFALTPRNSSSIGGLRKL